MPEDMPPAEEATPSRLWLDEEAESEEEAEEAGAAGAAGAAEGAGKGEGEGAEGAREVAALLRGRGGADARVARQVG